MRALTFILLFSFLQQVCCGQQLTFEELDAIPKTSRRMVIVFIHTEWCLYCRLEERLIRRSAELNSFLKDSFHFIKLDAAHTGSICFNDTVYAGGNTQQIHPLAEKLGSIDHILSYPTWVILDPHLGNRLIIPGFLTKDQLLTVFRTARRFNSNAAPP